MEELKMEDFHERWESQDDILFRKKKNNMLKIAVKEFHTILECFCLETGKEEMLFKRIILGRKKCQLT